MWASGAFPSGVGCTRGAERWLGGSGGVAPPLAAPPPPPLPARQRRLRCPAVHSTCSPSAEACGSGVADGQHADERGLQGSGQALRGVGQRERRHLSPRRSQPPPPQQRQPPSRLQRRLRGSRTAAEVLEAAVAGADGELTPGDAASALSSLAHVLRGADWAERQRSHSHPAVGAVLSTLQAGAAQLTTRQLAGVLQQCVWVGLHPPPSLLAALTEQLVRRLATVAPADACHAAWALTRLGHDSVARLLAAIDAAVQQQQGQQQGQEEPQQQERQQQEQGSPPVAPWLAPLPPASLVNLLWACAKAGFHSPPLLAGVAQALQRADPGLRSLTPQQASLVWYSLGALRWPATQQFLQDAAAAAQYHVPAFTPQGLANTGWGISRLPPGAQPALEPLAAAVAAAAAPRLGSFPTKELVMLVAAAAAPGSAWRAARAPLLAAAAEQVAAPGRQLEGRDLMSLLSAFATVRFEPPEHVTVAAARRLAQLLPSVPPASLAWLLWSLAHMPASRPPRQLLRKAEAALRGQLVRLYELQPADLARLCWALAELRYYSGSLLADLAGVCRDAWERMPPQSMALVLHSYARQQFTPHELLDAAAEHLAANLEQYNPQAVAVVLWSFGKLGVHPGRGLPGGGPCMPDGTPLMTAVAEHSTRCLLASHPDQQQQQPWGAPGAVPPPGEAFSLQGVSMLLWAYATLEHHPGQQLLQAVSTHVVAALREHAARPPAAGAEPLLGRLGAGELQAVSTVAWSFSRFGFVDEGLFASAAEALLAAPQQQGVRGHDPAAPSQQRQQGEEERQERQWVSEGATHSISSLAFAAAKLRVGVAPALLRHLLPAAAARLAQFDGEELCQLLWALSHAEVAPPLGFLDAAAVRLAALLARGMGGGADAAADARLLCMAVHALARLGYRADGQLLDACCEAVAAAAPDVTVSFLSKLVWGCAHVGHEPPHPALLHMSRSVYHRLSHSRGTGTVLTVANMVHLLWGLAALQQYGTQLYRNVAFRATRLPDGVPSHPDLLRLLREATVLHSCEHRLDPVAASAAAAILPAWMAGPQATQEREQQRQELLGWGQQAGEHAQPAQRQQDEGGSAAATAAPWLPGGVAGVSATPRQLELRAAAEQVCRGLQAGGLDASLKQLSFGDYVVLFDLGSSVAGSGQGGAGAWRARQGAVVPAGTPGRAAVNAPEQLLGSALVAQRVLSARGLPVVPGSGGEAELLARCRALLYRD